MPIDQNELGRYLDAHPRIVQGPWLGQEAHSISGPADCFADIQRVAIVNAYGRFGNNFYQIMNALEIADHFKINRIDLPVIEHVELRDQVVIDNITLVPNPQRASEISYINGSFFAPFGFERAFTCNSSKLARRTRQIGLKLFSPIFDISRRRKNTLVCHFRSGDVFQRGAFNHPAYVQPPAAFYMKIIDLLYSLNKIQFVDLVYQDRENPTIARVEEHLSWVGIPFQSRSSNLREDLRRLATADFLAASFGTLPEAVALMSPNIQQYFGFRNISSQSELAPFVQSKVNSMLKANGVTTIVVDDVSSTYIPYRMWDNSDRQREQMVNFSSELLRFYKP